MKVLLVDDDQILLQQLKKLLEELRYKVVAACNGEEALELLIDSPCDGIILDVMMPKMDGFTMLQELRNNGNTIPVLMLTARGDVSDRVQGLDLGADDYLAKPFSEAEFLARVRALLRRGGTQVQSVLRVSNIELDTVGRKVLSSGSPVELTQREFDLLEFLLHNKGRALNRFSILEHVWGEDFDPFSMSNVMDVHMKNLRRKIGDTNNNRIIRTIRGVGYIIEDEG
jgi:DNA-binding response OmpR family regulator